VAWGSVDVSHVTPHIRTNHLLINTAAGTKKSKIHLFFRVKEQKLLPCTYGTRVRSVRKNIHSSSENTEPAKYVTSFLLENTNPVEYVSTFPY